MIGHHQGGESDRSADRDGAGSQSDRDGRSGDRPGRGDRTGGGPGRHPVRALQERHGNQAVQRLAASGGLDVSSPDDAAEREADRVAERVVAGDGSASVRRTPARPNGPTVQTAADDGPAANDGSRAVGGELAGDAGAERRVRSLGGGRPLPEGVRSEFEPKLGASFGDVRIHTGPGAARAARDLDARAFTVGRHVAFGGGEYDPETQAGRRLLAHELTHVVQQRGGAATGRSVTRTTIVQRQTTGNPPSVPSPNVGQSDEDAKRGGECDEKVAGQIQTHLGKAKRWRSQAISRLERLRRDVRRQAQRAAGRRASLGTSIYGRLQRLEEHFRVSELVEKSGVEFPSRASAATSPSYTVRDFEVFGQATTDVLSNYRDVDLSLDFSCTPGCPKSGEGSEKVADAVPGSKEFRVFTGCWEDASGKMRTGIVLHEAFHASFGSFDHDSYSFQSDYPGPAPRTNADSYASYAAEVTTGSTFRVLNLDTTKLEGNVSDEEAGGSGGSKGDGSADDGSN